MGTWGLKAFENDGAADWAWSLPKDGLRAIEAAFDAVLDGEKYLEAPDCEHAIAAAEALCVLGGQPGAQVPNDVTKWAVQEKARPSSALIDKAKRSLQKILAASELKELWAESDESVKWEAEIKGIVSRLPITPPDKKPFWRIW